MSKSVIVGGMNLAEYISVNNPYFILVIFAISITYVIAVIQFLGRSKVINEKRRTSFFVSLTKGLINGTVGALEDVTNLYRGIRKIGDEEDFRYGLNSWLRQYLVYLLESDVNATNANRCKNTVSQFIKQNEASFPYSDLPDNERNILKDIDEYLASNNKDAAKRKLNELSGSIQVRYEELNRSQKQNRWSMPLTIIGLLLTLFFGALTIYLASKPVKVSFDVAQIEQLKSALKDIK
ncbi:MAG: hypothetical protein G01um10143_520 [Parcubacteria group bacterium Gr01-1014_3]|nr:MAG: hypothetical protein G01um10143_520 [Parcubacteria group bacterium Gr01-1014_3]